MASLALRHPHLHYPLEGARSNRVLLSRGRDKKYRNRITLESLSIARFSAQIFVIVAVSAWLDLLQPPPLSSSSLGVSAFAVAPLENYHPSNAILGHDYDRIRREREAPHAVSFKSTNYPVEVSHIGRGGGCVGALGAVAGRGDGIVVGEAAASETYYGTTDSDFKAWFSSLLSGSPLRSQYPHVFDAAVRAVMSWRRRYRGNPSLWRRIFKAERVAKELIEAVPIIDATMKIVEEYEPSSGSCDADWDGPGRGKITIVDLASGKGYLSMFLSEMLPPEKVEKFVLVDKAWPMCNAGEVLPHQMSWDHIYGNVTEYVLDDDAVVGTADGEREAVGGNDEQCFVQTGETYFTKWPIPLHTSKQDLKQKCNIRQMKKRLFSAAPGPIVVLAIHLCGALSLRAVDMFNNHDNVSFLALKPCCLPPMIYANRGDIFTLGRHSFDAKEVCSNGRFRGDRWYGPPRWHLEGRFKLWADHLYRGTDIGGDDMIGNVDTAVEKTEDLGRKRKFDVNVQVEGGFQNTYVFAQKRPITKSLWEEHCDETPVLGATPGV